ncbi:MAG: hypothetical protein ACKO8I_14395 [Cyanobacteriota bacterium]
MSRSPGNPFPAVAGSDGPTAPLEERTARLSVLIDPKKKAALEAICRREDLTPSQVVRQLIRAFIESRLGPDWRDQVLGSEGNESCASETCPHGMSRSDGSTGD